MTRLRTSKINSGGVSKFDIILKIPCPDAGFVQGKLLNGLMLVLFFFLIIEVDSQECFIKVIDK